MIDATVFTREMALICERFDRRMSKPVMTRYYETLSARLDTIQFELAARRVFDEETFFPSPQAFLSKLGDSVEASAEEEWTLALKGASQGRLPDGLSNAGAYALQAIGGLARLGRANESYEVPRLKKAFLNAYPAGVNRQANQETRALFALGDGRDERLGR